MKIQVSDCCFNKVFLIHTMGTSGFWSFFKDLVKTVKINEINGKPAFVDMIQYLHKYIIGMRKCGRDITLPDGKNVTHLYALTRIVKVFTDNNILPVFVIDGKSPLIKSDSVKKRKNIIKNAKEKCKELQQTDRQDTDEFIKNFKRCFDVTHQMLEECRGYLNSAGIPYVDAMEEADPQCAGLAHHYSSGVFSEDSDIILSGSPCLMKDLNTHQNSVSVIYMADIMNFMQQKCDDICNKHSIETCVFTKKNLIDFSFVMGNDYCNGIRCSKKNKKTEPNDDREILFELFTMCKFNMETFVETIRSMNRDKILFYISSEFLETWKNHNNVYTDVNIISPETIDIKMKNPQYDVMSSYLLKFGFKNELICHIAFSLGKLHSFLRDKHMKVSNPEILICDKKEEWVVVGKGKKHDRFVC